MRLENWCILFPGGLHGNVYGHPKFPDGKEVTTSLPVATVDNQILTKSGSLYILGEPKADYEAMFPGSRQRLISSLPQRKFFQ